MSSTRPVVGWTAIGPMESLCADCVDSEEAVRAYFEQRYRWVAGVYPIEPGETAALDEVACRECGARLAG